jgi:hypothetical protein
VLERFSTRAQRLVFAALLALFAAAIVVAIASTATLVGRTSLEMIERHYGDARVTPDQHDRLGNLSESTPGPA